MSDLLQPAYYIEYFICVLRIHANYGTTELLKTNFKETLIFLNNWGKSWWSHNGGEISQ